MNSRYVTDDAEYYRQASNWAINQAWSGLKRFYQRSRRQVDTKKIVG